MKALLLYPDRDFDPTLLLSRRDRSYARQKDPGGISIKSCPGIMPP